MFTKRFSFQFLFGTRSSSGLQKNTFPLSNKNFSLLGERAGKYPTVLTSGTFPVENKSEYMHVNYYYLVI